MSVTVSERQATDKLDLPTPLAKFMLGELSASIRRTVPPNSGPIFVRGLSAKVLAKWASLGVESINTMSRYLLSWVFGLGDKELEDLINNEPPYEGLAEALSFQIHLPKLTQGDLGIDATTGDRCLWFRKEMELPALQVANAEQIHACVLARKKLDSLIQEAFRIDKQYLRDFNSHLCSAPLEQQLGWARLLSTSILGRLRQEAASFAAFQNSGSFPPTQIMKFPINETMQTYIGVHGREKIVGMLDLTDEEAELIFPDDLTQSQIPYSWVSNTGIEIVIANDDCWKKFVWLCLIAAIDPDNLLVQYNHDAGYDPLSGSSAEASADISG